jgi:predicted glycoside hydrolase/deacetylase ChbG (UPF0249 family)
MYAKRLRRLLVIADDFGIGADTTAGILDLAARGVVTGSALLVNAPATLEGIRQWRHLGAPLELGWHPNLTLDSPLAPPAQIPSLVRPDGTFWPLVPFLKRWLAGRFQPREIHLELTLQLRRFTELVGHPPRFVNSHQHIALFPLMGKILLQVLGKLGVRPYVRRVQEPWSVVAMLPGARLKRIVLSCLGRRMTRIQEAHGFPGNDWLAGISNPRAVEDPRFFTRRLLMMPGQVVELMCHPGHYDATLVGRDCTASDGLIQQRVNELRWLRECAFEEAVKDAGFRLTAPSELLSGTRARIRCA